MKTTRIPIHFAADNLQSPSSGAIKTSCDATADYCRHSQQPSAAIPCPLTPALSPAGGEGETPLAHAVAKFNQVFCFNLLLPLEAKDVNLAAEVAERRGRHDIGLALRIALRDSQRVEACL